MIRSSSSQYTVFLATVVASLFAGCMPIKVWEVHPEPATRTVQNFLGEKPLGRPDAPPTATVGVQIPTVIDQRW